MAASTASPLTLLVIDDHPVFSDVLARALAAEPDMRIVAKAGDGPAAVQAWRRHRPAVTLLDLRALGEAGLRTLRQIRAIDSAACVVVIATTDHRRKLDEAAKAGAAFCITRSLGYDGLVAVVRRLHADGRAKSSPRRSKADDIAVAVTGRELEVLSLLRDGLSQDQISRRLAIADRTVRVHLASLKEKLEATSPAQCVARAYELGILRR